MSFNIETQLRSLRWTVPPEVQRDTLDAATTILRETTDRTAARRRWWRRAALLLLSLGALSLLLLTITSPPALTLAAVRQAMAEQRWVHIKYDSGREEWTNLLTGQTYFIDYDGRAVYTEPNGVRLWHWPETTYISKDRWFTGNAWTQPARPTTPWDQFVPDYQAAATQPASGGSLVQRAKDTLNGRSVIRFDCYMTDPLDHSILVQQVWADPDSRLPLKNRQILQLGDREKQHRDAMVGEYDFPNTGPSSIYDLGVARTDSIIDTDAKPAADLAGVFNAAEAASKKFPTCYRMIEWEQTDGAVNVVIRDGFHERSKRFFTYDTDHVPPPFAPTAEAILAWSASRVPIDEHVADGHTDFSRINPQREIPSFQQHATARVMGYLPPALPEDQGQFWFVDHAVLPAGLWSYRNISGTRELVAPPPDAPAGVLTLRRTAGDRRDDYWIDPAKGYICVRDITQQLIQGRWKNQTVIRLEQWVRLPTGQWIPTRHYQDDYGLPEKLADHVTSSHVTWLWMFTLESSRIPPGTFNGKTLLQGADVTTY